MNFGKISSGGSYFWTLGWLIMNVPIFPIFIYEFNPAKIVLRLD